MKFQEIKYDNFIDLEKEILIKICNWRNHPDISQNMRNTERISLDDHLKFVESLKYKEKDMYWLVSYKNHPVAVVYVNNIQNNIGEWGYYLTPDNLSSGLGFDVALSAFSHFKKIGLYSVYGDVKLENNCNIDLQRVVCDEEQNIGGYIRFSKDLNGFPAEINMLKKYKKNLLLGNKNE